MAVYPRTTEFGIATAWATADRPANAPHGFCGYNEDTEQMEIYDAVNGYWKTTTDLTQIYPA